MNPTVIPDASAQKSPGRQSFTHELPAIATGAGIIVLGTAAGALVRYLFQIVIAQKLGPELFGLFILGFSVYKIAAMAAEFGLPQAIIRFVPIFQTDGDEARTKGLIIASIRIVLAIGFSLCFFLILVSKPLAIRLFHNAAVSRSLIPLAVLLPLASATSILTSATQGFKVMKVKVIVMDIVEPLARIFLVFGLFLSGIRLAGVLASYIAAAVLACWLAWHSLKKICPAVAQRSLRPVFETSRLLSFAWPLFFLKFFGVLILWIDTLFLGYFKTAEDVGVYNAVQRTVVVGSVVIASFNAIFAPFISQLYRQERIGLLNNLFKIVAKWTWTLSLPLYLVMILFAPAALSAFGRAFTRGAVPLIILSLGWLVNSSTGSLGIMITMTGRPGINLLTAAGVLCVNVLLNLILIPAYGILGAAAATALSLTLGNLVSLLVVRHLLKMHPYRADFLKPLAAAGFSAAVVLGLRRWAFPGPGAAPIVCTVLIFFLFYALGLALMGFSEEEKATFNQLKKIFVGEHGRRAAGRS